MRKTVGVFLVDGKGRVLLQHRDSNAPKHPSRWGVFGGGIKNGENPIEAVGREFFEEASYHLENPKLIFGGNESDEVYAYLFVEDYNPEKEIIQREGDEMSWFSIKEIERLEPFVPHKQLILDVLKEHFEK